MKQMGLAFCPLGHVWLVLGLFNWLVQFAASLGLRLKPDAASVGVLEGAELLGEVMYTFHQVQSHLVVIQLFKISVMELQVHLHLSNLRQACLKLKLIGHRRLDLLSAHIIRHGSAKARTIGDRLTSD